MIENEEINYVYKTLNEIHDKYINITFSIERVLGEEGKEFSKSLYKCLSLSSEKMGKLEEK